MSAIGSGSPTITASYSGDLDHAGSQGRQSLTVIGHPTLTSLSCVPGSVAVGQSTKCTATVTDAFSGTPSTPSGTVSFFPGGPGSFNGNSPCTLSGSGASASCSATFTPSGANAGGGTPIHASYNGDAIHQSSSATTSVTVTSGVGSAPDSTATKVRCKPASVRVGRRSRCTVTVSDTASGGQTTPSGKVSFSSSGPGRFSSSGPGRFSSSGPGRFSSSGPRRFSSSEPGSSSAHSCALVRGRGRSASCSVSYTPSAAGTGSHTITAKYGGDSSHTPSSGTTPLTVRRTHTLTPR